MVASSSDTSMTDYLWTGKLRSFLSSFLITIDSSRWICKVPVLLKSTNVTSFDFKGLDLSKSLTVGDTSDSRISLLNSLSSSKPPFHLKRDCFSSQLNRCLKQWYFFQIHPFHSLIFCRSRRLIRGTSALCHCIHTDEFQYSLVSSKSSTSSKSNTSDMRIKYVVR